MKNDSKELENELIDIYNGFVKVVKAARLAMRDVHVGDANRCAFEGEVTVVSQHILAQLARRTNIMPKIRSHIKTMAKPD